jgi:hypothetical protein
MTSVAIITFAGGMLIFGLGLYSIHAQRLEKEARKKSAALHASEK